jgi:peptide-methionine (R)-S-oxide reductase
MTNEDKYKAKLTPEQYRVLREKGTEAPFSGQYLNHNEQGMYTCAACGAQLFKSESKYDSDIPGLAGWPSFADVIDAGAVELLDDDSLGMHRTEVVCKNCGSHLGHIFDDESSPTGKHYCINSVCLNFEKQA